MNSICQWINLRPSLASVCPQPTQDALAGGAIGLSSECEKIESGDGVYATDSRIPIPINVLSRYAAYRETPLFRARCWEEILNFRGQIWVKREDLTPSGSHKYNTAIAQAYYAKKQGFRGMVTDTGAGQWGLAVAMACTAFDMECVVFMAGHSYEMKAQRRNLMELTGARVHDCGQGKSGCREGVTDTLAAAMSQAMKFVRTNNDFCLSQGCMSMYAPMHQSIIGLEMEEQMRMHDIKPNMLIACAGGGTNLCGFAAPWIEERLVSGVSTTRIVAVESAEAPALTQGEYHYDTPDTAGMGGKQLVYSIGSHTALRDIGAAGLRYHCKSPLLSLLVKQEIVEAQAVADHAARIAGLEFFKAEGILPAPESAHALAFMKEFACGNPHAQNVTVAINLSGSGLLDIDYYGPELAE